MRTIMGGVWTKGLMVGALAMTAACASSAHDTKKSSEAIVAGAGYTTFDATQGGCHGGPNGVDCNNYDHKADVYMSGGPTGGNGLSDGSYYFAVLAPGAQANFLTTHDILSTDSEADRTFTTTAGAITYAGPHHTGTSPNGKNIVQLIPYADTPNAGGVYILAICQTGATQNSQCKFDAFRVRNGETVDPKFASISGKKYYDANVNGQWDPGEPGIGGWVIDYHDGVTASVTTLGDGTFEVKDLIADTYTFVERQGGSSWVQTGNTVDQSSVSGGASVLLNGDKSYDVTVVDDSGAGGINFGNVCIGVDHGHTLGFWSNKNGQALITTGDLTFLSSLHLRNADGTDFDPATKSALKSWLLSATATNMAYMLSAQLTAMELNVAHNGQSASALIYAPGVSSGNGFITVQQLMDAAEAELTAHPVTVDGSPDRAHQEAIKNALDKGNNNLNFLQAPGVCPTPAFL